MIAEAPRLTPRGSHLLIRLSPIVETTAGGIHLPEVAQRLPVSGVVLAIGPGRPIPGFVPNRDKIHRDDTGRTCVWSAVGDELIFQRKDLQPIEGDDQHALISAEDVLAWVRPNDTVCPENDYCLLELVSKEEVTAGGVVIPETGRKAAQSGILHDVGPGRLILHGPLFGTRKDVWSIMGLDTKEENIGKTFHLEGTEEVVHLSRPAGFVLVRAEGLMLVEGDE